VINQIFAQDVDKQKRSCMTNRLKEHTVEITLGQFVCTFWDAMTLNFVDIYEEKRLRKQLGR